MTSEPQKFFKSRRSMLQNAEPQRSKIVTPEAAIQAAVDFRAHLSNLAEQGLLDRSTDKTTKPQSQANG